MHFLVYVSIETNKLYTQIVEKVFTADKSGTYVEKKTERFPEGVLLFSSNFKHISQNELFRKTQNGDWLLVAGLPISKNKDISILLQHIINGDLLKSSKLLQTLDGAFVAIGYSSKNKKIFVITDFLGMQPCYIYIKRKYLILSNKICSITSAIEEEIQMDPAGWGAFISFGHTIGDLTLVKNVKRLPPAFSAEIDTKSLTISSYSYWKWPEGQKNKTISEIRTDEIIESLKQDCRDYINYHQPGTILLSGGFDSRLILAILKDIGIEPRALILNHNNELFGLDGRFASKSANVYNIKNDSISTSRSFYSSVDFLDFLRMSEIASPSLYLFISQVAHNLKNYDKAIWTGDAVGPAIKVHQPKGSFNEYIKEKTYDWDSIAWIAARNIFRKPRAEEMYEEFRFSLNKEILKYTDDDIGVTQFVFQNRNRNRTVTNALKVYANYALPFIPGISKKFCNATMCLPYNVKVNGLLARKLLDEHFPQAMTVPIISGTYIYPRRQKDYLNFLYSGINAVQNSKAGKLSDIITKKIFTGSWNGWEESLILTRAIENVNSEHYDLCKEQIEKLQKKKTFLYKGLSYQKRELLFYWKMWRLLMQNST